MRMPIPAVDSPSAHRNSDISSTFLDLSDAVTKEGTFYIRNGEFSDVYKGKLKNTIVVAIKVLRGAPAHSSELHLRVKERLAKAGHTWVQLKHPNILPFYGMATEFGYLPAMILPWCERGNILDYTMTQGARVDILKLLTGVIRGLAYLHSMDITHGDLRAANVLVSDKGIPLLADYGVTFVIDHGEFTTNKIAGPARWTAPEILDPLDGDENEPPYSFRSDMFAFAMTVVEICERRQPYWKIKNDSAVIFHIIQGKRPEIPRFLQEHDALTELVQKCWAKEPAERPTANEAQMLFEHALTIRSRRWRVRSISLSFACFVGAGIAWLAYKWFNRDGHPVP